LKAPRAMEAGFNRSRRFPTLLLAATFFFCVLLAVLPPLRSLVIQFSGKVIGHGGLDVDTWQRRLVELAAGGMVISGFCAVRRSPLLTRLQVTAQDSRAGSIAIATLIVAWAIVFSAIATQDTSIWLDETLSLLPMRHPFVDVMKIQSHDVHPPLYFILGKLWQMPLPDSVLWMKLLSVLAAILSMVALSSFLAKEVSTRAAIFFLLIMGACQTVLHQALEIRSYMWAYFFVSMLLPCGYYAVRKGTWFWWVGFLIAAECSAWMHLYAAVCAGLVYGLLLAYLMVANRAQLKKALTVAVLAVIIYIPWLPFTWWAYNAFKVKDFWIQPLNWRSFKALLLYPFGAADSKAVSAVLASLFVFSFALFVAKARRAGDQKKLLIAAGLLCPLLLGTIAIAVSVLTRPFLVDRYLFPSFGFIYVCFACGLAALELPRRFSVFPNTEQAGAAQDGKSGIIPLVISVALLILCVESLTVASQSARKDQQAFARFQEFLRTNVAPTGILILAPGIDVHILGFVAYLSPEVTQITSGYLPSQVERDWASKSSKAEQLGGLVFGKRFTSYTAFQQSGQRPSGAWIIAGNRGQNLNLDTSTHARLASEFAWDFYTFAMYYTDTPLETMQRLASPK